MAVLQTYKGADFVDVKDDDMLEVYDTSEPTTIGTWEDGIEATYRFLDERGNVLDSGTCRDGETPVYDGETPTKEHYHFTGWSPAVGPIYVNTDYVAQFTEDLYTVTLDDLLCFNDDGEGEFVTGVDWGDANKTSVQVPYGTICSANIEEIETEDEYYYMQCTLEFRTPGIDHDKGELLDSIIITSDLSTAQYFYSIAWFNEDSGVFTNFDPFTIEDDYTIEGWTIIRETALYGIVITVNDDTMGSIDVEYLDGLPYGTPISANGNVLTVGQGADATEITATPESGYVFTSWGIFPATLTEDLTITANFEAETPSHPLTMTVNNAEWGSITSQRYDDVHVGDEITYDGNTTGGNIKCNNDNISIVTVESGYEVDDVQGVPATYDGTPITVSVIFKASGGR